jgi:hypothetical protein
MPAMAHLLAALSLARLAAAAPGLTLTMWDNTARAGKPKSVRVISSPIVSLPAGAPFSADIEGTLLFNTSGVFEFYCNFSLTTTAFVWVDGHMVCMHECI